MKPPHAELIGPICDLGESPVWDSRTGTLNWADIEARRVVQWNAETDTVVEHPIVGRPGSIFLTPDPRWLVAAVEHSLVALDTSDGSQRSLVDLPVPGASTRLNDGRCDTTGRLWVGSMHLPATAGVRDGVLLCVDGDLTISTALDDIGIANGLAFTADGGTMYFADTARSSVWAYDEPDPTRARTSGRLFLDFAAAGLPGKPDGACIDASGCYWVACVYGSCIARVTPAGLLDRYVEVPVSRPTSCTFGGPGLSTLFVTSIGSTPEHGAIEGEPDGGHTFALDIGVSGVEEPVFAWNARPEVVARLPVDTGNSTDRAAGC